MLAVLDHFLWTLRREGFAVSTAQAMDVARVAELVGFSDRTGLRDALACVVADSRERRHRYQAVFDEFFSLRAARSSRSLVDRLLAQGFSRNELAALNEHLNEFMSPQRGSRLRALLGGGADLDHLLAGRAIRDLFGRLQSRDQKAFFTHRILDELGIERARSALAVLRDGLADAMEIERAEALLQALMRELERSERRIRDQVEHHLEQREAVPSPTDSMSRPFALLTEAEVDEVRQAVRRLAERLRGAARVRQRHQRRGRIHPARTMRKSLATDAVPFQPVRRDQRRDRPKLVVLCDVSDSVRPASRFMLEFVYAVQELFDRTRSFVFVSEIGEVTDLFADHNVSTAISHVANAVDVRSNSSYGRVFRELERRFSDALDRRTTVLILGDGRTNYQPSGAEILGRIRDRARTVIWLCPEPRVSWGTGDNAMPEYAKQVTRVLEVACARDLERAARELIARR